MLTRTAADQRAGVLTASARSSRGTNVGPLVPLRVVALQLCSRDARLPRIRRRDAEYALICLHVAFALFATGAAESKRDLLHAMSSARKNARFHTSTFDHAHWRICFVFW
ncbi:hypothetical protein TRVL_09377 [Trypanosoma vivax]|nr:hypothetical protein TRVL_09377 [Trypanosoma vivax]